MASNCSPLKKIFLASVLSLSGCHDKLQNVVDNTWYEDAYVQISLGHREVFSNFYELPLDIRKDLMDSLCQKHLPFLIESVSSMDVDVSKQAPLYEEVDNKEQFLKRPDAMKSPQDIQNNNNSIVTGEGKPKSFFCDIGMVNAVQVRAQDMSFFLLNQATQAWLHCQLKQIDDYHTNVVALYALDPSRLGSIEGAYRRGFERTQQNMTLDFVRSQTDKRIERINCQYPKIR